MTVHINMFFFIHMLQFSLQLKQQAKISSRTVSGSFHDLICSANVDEEKLEVDQTNSVNFSWLVICIYPSAVRLCIVAPFNTAFTSLCLYLFVLFLSCLYGRLASGQRACEFEHLQLSSSVSVRDRSTLFPSLFLDRFSVNLLTFTAQEFDTSLHGVSCILDGYEGNLQL